ncbi:hypothetical protein HDU79_009549 [Rhizoclosmatium sp. JEL0117]|nr:hypothetical protein HDU79_009549 [Rhizoclosmatium sp. JEL0117]
MFGFNRAKRTPLDLVKGTKEYIAKLSQGDKRKANEEISKNLVAMKGILYGDGVSDPSPELVAQLSHEIYNNDILPLLIGNIWKLEFEAKKDVSQIFNNLLRRQIGTRFPTAEYVSARPEILRMLMEGKLIYDGVKLLGEVLLDRTNYSVMAKYISSPDNLKLMMNLLRDKSRNIQFEAFHVFKVFVANPNKAKPILDILQKNKEKLVTYLTGFHNDRTGGSTEGYVDNQLIGTGKIAHAAIRGHDGSLWATSAGFDINATEINNLVAAFKDASGIRANGLYAGGVKYFTLRADDRSIYGKQGAGGIVCVKTKMAILIGVYADPTQPGEATKVVEALADYLIGVGYVSAASASEEPTSSSTLDLSSTALSTDSANPNIPAIVAPAHSADNLVAAGSAPPQKSVAIAVKETTLTTAPRKSETKLTSASTQPAGSKTSAGNALTPTPLAATQSVSTFNLAPKQLPYAGNAKYYSRYKFQPTICVETAEGDEDEEIFKVEVRGWRISAKMMEILGNVLTGCSGITHLVLWNCGLTESHFVFVLGAILSSNIRHLNLDQNPEVPETLYAHLLVEDSLIKHLSLRSNKITCVGAKALAASLKTNRVIQTLDLWANLIAKDGASDLAEVMLTL